MCECGKMFRFGDFIFILLFFLPSTKITKFGHLYTIISVTSVGEI